MAWEKRRRTAAGGMVEPTGPVFPEAFSRPTDEGGMVEPTGPVFPEAFSRPTEVRTGGAKAPSGTAPDERRMVEPRAHIPGGIFRRRAVCDRWREGQGRRGAQRAQLSSVQRRAEETPEEAGEEPTAMEDPSNAATFSAITVASSTLPSASITYRLGIHFT